MIGSPKIALEIPREGKASQDFYFRLKTEHIAGESEFIQPEKMLVISDIEGNYNAFIKLLLHAGVIDTKMKWTFGENHLVILGDAFDKGDQVIECIWLIYALEEKANRKGGHIHYILGNHEIMNLNGDWRYIHPKYSSHESVAIYHGNQELWKWLCTKNIVEKIGQNIFVHGGIAPELLKYDLSLDEMNNYARPWYRYSHEPFTDPLVYALLIGPNSPVWYRGYYNGSIDENTIVATLHRYDSTTIITGHSVVEKISCFFNRRVINVDTNHATGQSQALYVEGNKYYRIGLQERKTRIK